jgi:hypothetical protein
MLEYIGEKSNGTAEYHPELSSGKSEDTRKYT